MEYTIRTLKKQEYPLLNEFLYEAVFVPADTLPPPKSILDAPELQVYVSQFGAKKDDCALAAEASGRLIGAVWTRIMDDYGHLDNSTPSLAISLYPEYRSQGVGTALMKEMLALLKTRGYQQVSLSVQKSNPAANLYRRFEFQTVRETEEEWIMVCVL